MDKNKTKIYLGIGNNGKCCVIWTDGIQTKYDAVDWGGCADIQYTMDRYHFEYADGGKYIEYHGYYSGEDSDWGHGYPFCFEFNYIIEVKEKPKNEDNLKRKKKIKKDIKKYKDKIEQLEKEYYSIQDYD